MNGFSLGRFMAILVKEFVQMRRDRLTFAMIIGIPIMQLVLFGFAINSDPKALPAVVRAADNSAFSRAFVVALKNSGYFAIEGEAASESEAQRLIETGRVQFVINIPSDFARELMQGRRPQILVEADATDPAATSNAIAALTNAARSAFDRELVGALSRLKAGADPIELVIHRRYNPEGITQYNVVPGLMGVVLTMTMVVMTAMAMTRERERGTIEALLATPARPGEVMLGKIVPYIAVGYIQVVLILLASWALFAVPIIGSLWLLLAALVVFIAANLCIGFTISTVAQSQLQAMQMSFFFFLPSLLLSGFMFPFRGMPDWAQTLGEVFPLTHFLRIIRGVLLKGNAFPEIAEELVALMAILSVVTFIAMKRYRRTLD
jgi:ABC-2 type transport system permease protein